MIPLCNCQSFSYNDFTFGILLYKYMDLFLLIFLPCLINFQIYTYAWSLEFSWNFPRIELDYKNITKWKIIIFKDSGAWLKQGGYFLHEKESKNIPRTRSTLFTTNFASSPDLLGLYFWVACIAGKVNPRLGSWCNDNNSRGACTEVSMWAARFPRIMRDFVYTEISELARGRSIAFIGSLARRRNLCY